jgi:hypothetical protein
MGKLDTLVVDTPGEARCNHDTVSFEVEEVNGQLDLRFPFLKIVISITRRRFYEAISLMASTKLGASKLL